MVKLQWYLAPLHAASIRSSEGRERRRLSNEEENTAQKQTYG
jgi:hypothetical protein